MPDFDFKCSVQTQLDRLWLTPDDLAHALGVRPASVRIWLDPEVPDRLPAKEAFNWLRKQADAIGELIFKRFDEALAERRRWGQAIVRYYREPDLQPGQLLGRENLASSLVADKLENKGEDVAMIFACRDDAYIDSHLDSWPEIDPKAAWVASMDALGVTTLDVMNALDVSRRTLKDWRDPAATRSMPFAEAYDYLDFYAEALEGRTQQLIEQHPNPMPYHAISHSGKLTQQERIDNKAALAAANALMAGTDEVIDFSYV